MNFRKRFLAVTFNQGLQTFAQVAMLAMAARALAAQDYGIYRKYFLIFEIGLSVLGLGAAQAVYVLLSKVVDKKLLFQRLAVMCLVGAICGVPFIALAVGGLSDAQELLGSSPPLLFVSLIFLTFVNLLLPVSIAFALDSGWQGNYVIRNCLVTLVSLAIFTFVAMKTSELRVILWVRAGLSCVAAVALSLSVYRTLHPANSSRDSFGWRSLLAISLPPGLATAFGMMSQQVDKLIAAKQYSAETYAKYAVGAMEVPLVSVVIGSLTSVALLEMSRAYQRGDLMDIVQLLRSIASRSALVLFPLFFLLFTIAPDLIELIFGDFYRSSALVFQTYLLLLPVRIIQYGPVLLSVGLGSAVWKRSVGELLICIPATLIATQVVGYHFIALGLVITVYCWSVPYNLTKIVGVTKVPLTCLLPWRNLVSVALISAFATVGPYCIGEAFIELPIAMRLFLQCLTYGSCVLLGFIALGILDIRAVLRSIQR